MPHVHGALGYEIQTLLMNKYGHIFKTVSYNSIIINESCYFTDMKGDYLCYYWLHPTFTALPRTFGVVVVFSRFELFPTLLASV